MAEPKDLTGQRFGKLVVLSLAEPRVYPSGQKQRRWLCHCDCGNDKIINQIIIFLLLRHRRFVERQD